MLIHLEFKDKKSSKFWEIEHGSDSDETTVRFGKIGSDGQSQTKKHASAEVARAFLEKQVRDKVAKGYVETARNESGDEEEDKEEARTDEEEDDDDDDDDAPKRARGKRAGPELHHW